MGGERMSASKFAGTSSEANALAFARSALDRTTPRFALTAYAIGAGVWLTLSTTWGGQGQEKTWREWFQLFATPVVLTTCMTFAIALADEAVDRGARRFRAYAVAVVVGAATGAVLNSLMLQAIGRPAWMARWEVAYALPVYLFLHTLSFGGLVVLVYANVRSSIAAAQTRNAAEIARIRARRHTIESQLQAMQARVEPTFLFNTLGHVRALYADDPAVAGRMLDDLITYLRAALPHLRESSSTLGKEMELAKAYLNIMRLRIGERLEFSIVAGSFSHDARFPPMLLLPLIDHALTHAVSAARGSCRVVISATTSNDRVTVALTDSAGAFVEDHAVRLQPIADRMGMLYGKAGTFSIERLPDGCSRAILEVPT
jgi:hypothetical protein